MAVGGIVRRLLVWAVAFALLRRNKQICQHNFFLARFVSAFALRAQGLEIARVWMRGCKEQDAEKSCRGQVVGTCVR